MDAKIIMELKTSKKFYLENIKQNLILFGQIVIGQ